MQSRSLFIAFLLFFAAGPARPADADTAGSAPDLAALSIEQLTQVEVTSVGRKDQNLSQVAAAVFVITAEDIRRSGVANVPELLRMVPGIQVAQIAANIWAISSRGFNGRGANKMLVMVDGRSIYNTLFSGTFWDQNQVPLD
ncbi:MAG: TonB-dependent receptor plug domain-containing protein, partial [Bryobacteraceae bacterium]